KPQPTVRVNPHSSVYIGDTVTLSCELQWMTGFTFSWYKYEPSGKLSAIPSTTRMLNVTVFKLGKIVYQCSACRPNTWGDFYTEYSDPVQITASKRPKAVLSVSPQNWLTEGDSVTLSCEVTDSSTNWTFSWYTVVPYRDGVTQITMNHYYVIYVELLSDSSRGSGGNYTLSPSALHHTGVYVCRGERGESVFHTKYSNQQPLWIS
ncbi:Fc receptor-like protein 5, partial [Silurus asotus]